jgi:hypothetical protein
VAVPNVILGLSAEEKITNIGDEGDPTACGLKATGFGASATVWLL